MLLRFMADNVLSIADPQEISLVASKLKDRDEGLIPVPGGGNYRAVPVALIYGANASGKSNFVRAFAFMRNAILMSHSAGSPNGGVPRKAFELDEKSSALPSCLECEFVASGVRYIFGFTCSDESYLTEWLYAFPEGKQRKLYERDGKSVNFGATMLGPKKALVEFMRSNSLFISTATQNDHEELTKIVQFFRDSQVIRTLSVSSATITNTFKEKQIDPRAIKFLGQTGTGIVGIEQSEKDIPEQVKNLNAEFLAVARKHLGDDVQFEFEAPGKDIEIQLVHQGSNIVKALPLRQESAGTRRLLVLISNVMKALDKGSLIIIDELDASLHTLVAEQIIRLFSDPVSNPHGSQMIATTHDTNVLSCNHLRRDQIWFTEKSQYGASSLFSLSDFKLRSGDKFEKGYLEGRFGAIPFAGNIRDLANGERR